MSNFPGTRGERRAYSATLGAVVAIHLAVLWIPAYNTLVDYPFHLSRAWALHTYNRTPFFQEVFVRVFDPMPNLAIDLIVPPLLHFLPPIAAGKVFLSMIVLLFAAGCHWLTMAVYDRPSWMAPLAVFAVFNSTFFYGLVNSAFSLSLFLITMAAWLRFRRGWTVFRWLIVAVLATATYIAHLSGFVFLGLAMGLWRLLEFREKQRVRTVDLVGFCILLPAVLIQLYPWANKVQIGAQILWGSPVKKTVGLASVFLGFRYDLDVLATALLAVAFAIAAWKGKARMERHLLWLGVAFLILSFACPTQLTAGGGSAADARFVPPALVFLCLSFGAKCPRSAGVLALAIAYSAMLLRIGEVGWNLNQMSSAAELQIAALAKAKPNTRVYDLFLMTQDRQELKRVRGNWHLPSYSLLLTQSVSSDFYGVRGVQPLYFRNPAEWVFSENPTLFHPEFLDAHLGRFDYVWGCNLDPPHIGYLEQRATLVATGDICGLWKLKK